MIRIQSFVFSVIFLCFSVCSYSQTLLFSDDFESGLGNWLNVSSGDNKQWSRDSAGTTSSGTGPSTGAGSTWYVYLETSSGSAYTLGDSAILLGPPVSGAGIQFKFDYHMYGSNMGSLYVDVLSSGAWINNVWSISGQQHSSNSASYSAADIDLSSYSVSQIRLRAVAAGGYMGDMAIDNVEIWSAPTGPLAPQFNNDPVASPDAIQDQPYSGSIAGEATDANGDLLTFSKVSGPDWLSVTADGTLSGTPGASDVGLNNFVVEVSDGLLTSSATLNIQVNDNTTPILLFSDDFEQGYGNWVNTASGDNKQWTRDSAGTTSGGTGPVTGADGSTWYAYLETSSGYAYTAGDTAILLGPSLSGGDVSLSFRYHMYGLDMGSLAVDVLSSGIWINDIWSISGQQHTSNSATYSQAEVDLSGYAATQIRFRASAVGSYRGDMAIDNIEIWSIPIVGPVAPGFNQDPLVKAEATLNQDYSESIAADAQDANGDALGFSKISGPAWLSVSSEGQLSGTPDLSDVGLNTFIVEVSDGALSSTATLEINVDDGMGPIILFSDDFESGFGNWGNASSGDSHNWTLHSGGTSSSNTGPASGEGGGGSYLYMETSSGSAYTAGNSVILNSPTITDQQIHLSLYYYMYGSEIGSLAVDIYSSGAWLNNVWSLSGQQHSSSTAAWSIVDIDLSSYDVEQIRIRATAVGGFMGDTGIDSIEISSHFNPNDLDSDGVLDSVDQCPNTPSNETADATGCSPSQVDSDNDGVVDGQDAFPNDPTETVDTDGDLIGNNADPDDDGDGVIDTQDAFPLDANESVDTDGDGVGNNADTDDDNDGILDSVDGYPLINIGGLADQDGDGIPNDCDTACLVLGMSADTDDDNDGVIDANDAFPLDASEQADFDADGIGNNADSDDDNDGSPDASDAFPLDSSESLDTDGDGIGNNADTDDDGDGVSDSEDALPLDPNETIDTDGDGIGDNSDSDDDGDGMPDTYEESYLGLDPKVNDAALDLDGDGLSNLGEYQTGTDPLNPDTDGDGVNDSEDILPLNDSESTDFDGDGIGDNADTDDDNDGFEDSRDPFPKDASRPQFIEQRLHDITGDGVTQNVLYNIRTAGLGDINNDGFDDFVVVRKGSYLRAYSGMDASLLYDLPVTEINGFGDDIAVVGDINQDGVNDLAVTAPYPDDLHVISGADGSAIYHWQAIGGGGTGFQMAVAAAGDVNGDGFPDILIGAEGSGANNEGYAELRSGADGSIIRSYTGSNTGGRLGSSLTGLGDLNGDSYDDYAIKIYSGTHPSNQSIIRVYSGNTGNILKTISGNYGRTFGYRLKNLGDIDQDGKNEMGAGDPMVSSQDGQVLVVKPLSNDWLYSVRGEAYGRAGYDLASVGDIDGDTIPDFIVNVSALGNGEVWLSSGANGRVLHRFIAQAGDDHYGYGLDLAGDVNGDGHTDYILAASIGGRAEVMTLLLDSDGDGIADDADQCPNSIDINTDSSGCNHDQRDDDGDGYANGNDAFPDDIKEWLDSDMDGVGNNGDTDDDNDGVLDGVDAFPLNPNESVDTDLDGVGNNSDSDDDNDGLADGIDAYPLVSILGHTDTDNDGAPDNCDSVCLNQGMFADDDDDNDGVPDSSDDLPLDASESLDTDSDGIGNNLDTDDDNDGVLDEHDVFPLDETEHLDTDGDGIGNNADTDDDGDGILDSDDPYPLYPGDGSAAYSITVNITGTGGVRSDQGDCFSSSCTFYYPLEATTTSIEIIEVDADWYFKDWPMDICTNSNPVSYKRCDIDLTINSDATVEPLFKHYPQGKLQAGGYHTCYLENGQVFCWGAGQVGQTGSMDKGQSIVPATLVAPSDMSTGFNSTCVVDQGTVECWGDMTNDDPAARANLVNASKVSAGLNHVCAQDDNGVSCWGDNTYGQLNVPPEVYSPNILVSGSQFSCALENSQVYCWGQDSYGKATPPLDLVNPHSLVTAPGVSHSCVIDNGAPRCWGFNGNGEVDNPEAVVQVVDKVFVGDEWDSCVRYSADSRYTCWKYNGTSSSASYSPYFQFVSGRYHKCTLKKSVSCSASNDSYNQDYVPLVLREFLENQ